MAFQHFIDARRLGAHLPNPALYLVATTLADNADTSPEAIDVYLAQLGCAGAERSERVLGLLRRTCSVEESSLAAARKAALLLNQRVIAVRADIEWAHYFSGLACTLNENFCLGADHFQRALKLNPGRSLTHYWLGVCNLKKSPPDVSGAAKAISRFIDFAEDDPTVVRRQAQAAFDLATHLVTAIGGYGASHNCGDEHARSTLTAAVSLLKSATARDPNESIYWFSLARCWSLMQEPEKAIPACIFAIEKRPAEKEYHWCLATEQLKVGLLDQARDVLKAFISLDPDNVCGYEALARICLRLENPVLAEAYSRSWLRLTPDNGKAFSCLIQALFSQGRYVELLAEVERRPQRSRTSDISNEAMLAIGRAHANTGDFRKACEWYDRLPDGPAKWYHLGCALGWLGDAGSAIATLEVARRSGGPYASKAALQLGHLETSSEAAQEHYMEARRDPALGVAADIGLAWMYYRDGDYERAHQLLARAPKTPGLDGELLFATGAVCERVEDYAGAISCYSQLSTAQFGRQGDEANVRAAVLLCRMGEYLKARERLVLTNRDGEQADAVLFYRGLALVRSGDVLDGICDWEHLHKRHPNDNELAVNISRAYYALARDHAAAGRLSDAAAALKRCLASCPHDVDAKQKLANLLFRVAVVRLRSADYDGASPLLEEAVAEDPTETTYQFYLALSDLKIGHFDQCEDRLRSLEPEPRVSYHLAIALLNNRNVKAALQLFESLVQDDGPVGDGYSSLAAWAAANERIRQGRYAQATRLLARTCRDRRGAASETATPPLDTSSNRGS